MARTESRMLPLGTTAPDFTLPDPYGDLHTLPAADEKQATVIMFICNHCPFVKHVRGALVALAADYMPLGVAVLAINSNDSDTYPDDSPENMRKEAERQGYPFPYLVDDDQSVAKAYEATCTPDFFVFDTALTLRYRGQLDDSRPGNGKSNDGHDIRSALDAVLTGAPVSTVQTPSIGCNIKWKPGNAPDWAT